MLKSQERETGPVEDPVTHSPKNGKTTRTDPRVARCAAGAEGLCDWKMVLEIPESGMGKVRSGTHKPFLISGATVP